MILFGITSLGILELSIPISEIGVRIRVRVNSIMSKRPTPSSNHSTESHWGLLVRFSGTESYLIKALRNAYLGSLTSKERSLVILTAQCAKHIPNSLKLRVLRELS
jgi:hypothetical protein